MINRIYGGFEKPERLRHTFSQGERSVALGKDVHFANPERVQHRVVQEGKGGDFLAKEILNGEAERSRFVVPFQGTGSDGPVTQGGASLALG